MTMRRVEQQLVLAAEQEAGLAGDGRAAHRAEQMADQAAADARIEHDRHRPAGELAGIEPLHGALAGEAADRLGRVEIGIMADAVAGMVALHVAALAGDHAGRRRHSRWSYSRGTKPWLVASATTVRPALTPAPSLIGDAGDGARRILDRQRALLERDRRGIGAVVGLERRARRRAAAAPRARGRHRDLPAPRAPSPRRARPERASASADRSEEETLAERRPTNKRRPISSPSERSTSSSAPSRTCTSVEASPI